MRCLDKSISLFVFVGWFVMASAGQAQSTDRFDLDETYSISPEGTVMLQSDDADVSIIGSDREDVHVVVHYLVEVKGFSLGERDRFDMEITERNGNVVINENPQDFQGRNVNFGYINEEYSILIEVPRSVSLEIEGDDDTYDINGIDGAVRMDTDDSEIALSNCRGNYFRIDFDDSDLTMDGGSGELRLSFDDGTADIRNARFDRVDVDTDDGNITMDLMLAESGSYTFTTDDGRVDLNILGGGGNFRIDHDEIRVRAGTNFEMLREDERYNEYQLAGGNAVVRIETDNGEVRLYTE